jgi:hypothetical protein
MPWIIIQAIPPGGERADTTLSERVAAANLDTPHYSAQLLARLTWATADAEALESRGRPCEPGKRPAILRPPRKIDTSPDAARASSALSRRKPLFESR